MKPQIVRLHSPDVYDLRNFCPQFSKFGFLLQIIAGPEGLPGEESFDLVVCTSDWIEDLAEDSEFIVGRHYLIVREYNFDGLVQFIDNYASTCTGANWREVALKLGRLGRWEFEDYQ